MIGVLLLLSQLCFAETTSSAEASSDIAKQQSSQAKLSKLYADIERLREENLGCSSTNECYSMELGSKSCGGPERYLVLSKKNKAIQRIQDMAKEYLELQKASKAQSGGMFSNCMFVGPTEVVCLKGKCQEVLQ